MKTVGRKDLPNDYIQIIEKENHHNQDIILTDNGILRWRENKDITPYLKNISLNDLIPLLQILGYGKNSEVYRKLYRDMGYSLSGYWEIFYWDGNNENFDQYRPTKSWWKRFKEWITFKNF